MLHLNIPTAVTGKIVTVVVHGISVIKHVKAVVLPAIIVKIAIFRKGVIRKLDQIPAGITYIITGKLRFLGDLDIRSVRVRHEPIIGNNGSRRFQSAMRPHVLR